MIGGTDITFEVDAVRWSPQTLLYACLMHWPESLYQKADQLEAYPVLAIIHRLPSNSIAREFFIYRNKESYEIWMKEGASDNNLDTMIHFLITGPEKKDHPYFRITMVSDKHSPDIRAIELTIKAFAEQHYALLDPQLQLFDPFLASTEVFTKLVWETHHLYFPAIPTLEMMFNPRIGVQFCELVRWRIRQPLPDNMIMRQLFLQHKQLLEQE